MKARKIYEQNFEQGAYPYKTLQIGRNYIFKDEEVIILKKNIFVYWATGFDASKRDSIFIHENDVKKYPSENIVLSLNVGTYLKYSKQFKAFAEKKIYSSDWGSAGWEIADLLLENPDLFERIKKKN